MQEEINKLYQMQQDFIRHQLYGSYYMKKPDGSMGYYDPNGNELTLPKYYGDDDEL